VGRAPNRKRESQERQRRAAFTQTWRAARTECGKGARGPPRRRPRTVILPGLGVLASLSFCVRAGFLRGTGTARAPDACPCIIFFNTFSFLFLSTTILSHTRDSLKTPTWVMPAICYLVTHARMHACALQGTFWRSPAVGREGPERPLTEPARWVHCGVTQICASGVLPFLHSRRGPLRGSASRQRDRAHAFAELAHKQKGRIVHANQPCGCVGRPRLLCAPCAGPSGGSRRAVAWTAPDLGGLNPERPGLKSRLAVPGLAMSSGSPG